MMLVRVCVCVCVGEALFSPKESKISSEQAKIDTFDESGVPFYGFVLRGGDEIHYPVRQNVNLSLFA